MQYYVIFFYYVLPYQLFQMYLPIYTYVFHSKKHKEKLRSVENSCGLTTFIVMFDISLLGTLILFLVCIIFYTDSPYNGVPLIYVFMTLIHMGI